MNMNKVNTLNGYDFYLGIWEGKEVFNIVPQGNGEPKGGYYDVNYICKMKGQSVESFKLLTK